MVPVIAQKLENLLSTQRRASALVSGAVGLIATLMFTGITRGLCPVKIREKKATFLRYAVTLPVTLAEGLQVGASVAVDGVCQTVAEISGTDVTFEAIGETLSKTTLDNLADEDSVSIERSVTFSTELGGHCVGGHVWGTATIDEVEADAERRLHVLWLRVPQAWSKYLFPKGFVAVDGSSLTIGACEHSGPDMRFSLYLIPETLRVTRLGRKQIGERVNIELDAQTVTIVDTVERVLGQRGEL